mmetsp:Transcript_34950/g.81788  ORF Transcript_34950/g.81788 Transcript_34950/m.81788 type:complete len:364 (-) Transcript_34950:38-1129(-)
MGIAPRDPQRPSPLHIAETPFKDFNIASPDTKSAGHCREVPVRRTFIEYGSQVNHGNTTPGRKALRSAPARVSYSLRDIFKSWEAECQFSQAPPERHNPVIVPGPPGVLGCTSPRTDSSRGGQHMEEGSGSGTPLTEIRYCLSPTSARAAGYDLDKALVFGAGKVGEDEGLSTASLSSLEMRCDRAGEQQLEEIESPSKPQRWTDMDSTSSDDSDDEEEGVCPKFSENAPLPSVGSAGHGAGTCKRCCFFPKGRCMNGEACEFCHFAHGKRKNKSKAKKKRRKRRQQELLLQQQRELQHQHQQHQQHHQQQQQQQQHQQLMRGQGAVVAACGVPNQYVPGFGAYWPPFVPAGMGYSAQPKAWR